MPDGFACVNRIFQIDRKNRRIRHLRHPEAIMRAAFTLVFLACSMPSRAAESSKVLFASGPALPKGGEVALVPAGKPGPSAKEFRPTLQSKLFDRELDLVGTGPFDVYFTPKGGRAVLAVVGWKPAKELKLSSHFGTVCVRGDDLPRARAIVLTLQDDPGPGEKGHAPIQTVADYKEDLVVPDGFYAVWIVPDNGAKARKVEDKIRVYAGRQTVVPE